MTLQEQFEIEFNDKCPTIDTSNNFGKDLMLWLSRYSRWLEKRVRGAPWNMDGLELVETHEGKYYWCFDFRYSDNSGGVYLNSKIYETQKEAVHALIDQTIFWESRHET